MFRLSVVLWLSTAALLAQIPAKNPESPPAKAPPATVPSKPEREKEAGREEPPQRAALRATRKIEDPVKRIEAIREVLKKYPDTDQFSPRLTIFEQTIKAYPDDEKRIIKAGEEALEALGAHSRQLMLDSLAKALLHAGLLLNRARDYAERSLAVDRKEFFKNARERSERQFTDEVLDKWYNEARNTRLETLGLIAIRQGRIDEGRRTLTKVLEVDPIAAEANVAMAKFEEADGNEAKALDHLLLAKLSGQMPEDAQPALERLYAKEYGSLDALEDSLDAIYHKRLPPPFEVERYQAGPGRTRRVVLTELFTGSGCPPCRAADLALDAVLERYSRDEVIGVVYHQHIPEPDPMAFPATKERLSYYTDPRTPTYVVDGDRMGGGGDRTRAKAIYDTINGKVEKRLNEPPEASLTVRPVRRGNKVVVQIAIDPIVGEGRDLRLQVLLVERLLRYRGENGIPFHPMVVRSIAGPESVEGFKLERNKRYEREVEFDIPAIVQTLKAHLDDYEVNGDHGKVKFSRKMHEIGSNNLVVVAFVEDAAGPVILQSNFSEVGRETGAILQ